MTTHTIDERLIDTKDCKLVGFVQINDWRVYMHWHQPVKCLFGTLERSTKDIHEHKPATAYTTYTLCLLIDSCDTTDTITIPPEVMRLWTIYRPQQADIVKNKLKNQKDLQRYHAKKLKNLI